MSSFISENERQVLTGLLDRTIETFQRNIVVWKEPIKTAIIPPSSTPQGGFGFGDGLVEQQYDYIPVSGVFPAVIRYVGMKHVGEATPLTNTNSFLPIGEVRIKVRQDCYQFIENGKTDKISFDDKDFFFVGKAQTASFLGNSYYQYQLKPKV
jgi:hypothetical protein